MNASTATSLRERASAALDRLRAQLLNELNEQGHWTGELSSSALSTAVATIALGEIDRQLQRDAHRAFVQRGLNWLAANVNADGGWGDTIRSKSNISTTALCWAAFGAAGADEQFPAVVRNSEMWLTERSGALSNLPETIAARYGKDRTFSVPILMTCALAGRLGAEGWRKVPPLPFELALFPRGWFGALKLPVVSYALPALIAIGQVIHHHAPSRNPIARLCRSCGRTRTLWLLSALQPENGGFLEATPLTAFVTMSLASAGHAENVVARKGAAFLRNSIRDDGSWPIDTNLATWVTTLSIKAGAHCHSDATQRARLRGWLLNQQYKMVHPYTGAAPGGWAWTDLPGGVPDADDTAGALLALYRLRENSPEMILAVEGGIRWLLGLQNSDGGIPTFCRGWGTLPFDRSTPEITVHALRAFHAWRREMTPALQSRIAKATSRALRFLQRSQLANGSFIPLWFGNENGHDDQNPVYGTAQVLIGLQQLSKQGVAVSEHAMARAARFLAEAQNANGGWGGDKNLPESVEETALAVEALAPLAEHHHAVERGLGRLLELLEANRHERAAPIGFYFARLWYYERLYPLIFSLTALNAANDHLKDR